MLKNVHPGLTAAAILAGPVALVLGYHHASNYFFPPPLANPAASETMQAIYRTCSEVPRLHRTVRCDTYVSYFDACTNSRHGCDIDDAYALLSKLEFDLPPLRLPQPEAAAIADLATGDTSLPKASEQEFTR